MSIELKHLEGLIRLCETASPDKLNQIRSKLVKYMKHKRLDPAALARDDAKLRELWSQLNCGEPYPEIPSSILGAGLSQWDTYMFKALALLMVIVFMWSRRPPSDRGNVAGPRLEPLDLNKAGPLREPPVLAKAEPLVPNAPRLSQNFLRINDFDIFPIHDQNSGSHNNKNSVCAAYSALYAAKIFLNEPLDYLNTPVDFSGNSPVAQEVRQLYDNEGADDSWWATPALANKIILSLAKHCSTKQISVNVGTPISARHAHYKSQTVGSGNFFNEIASNSYIILATVVRSDPEKDDKPPEKDDKPPEKDDKPPKKDDNPPEKAAPNRRQGFTFAIVHRKESPYIYVIDTHVKLVRNKEDEYKILALRDDIFCESGAFIEKTWKICWFKKSGGLIARVNDGFELDRFLYDYYRDPREDQFLGINAEYEYITMGAEDVNFQNV